MVYPTEKSITKTQNHRLGELLVELCPKPLHTFYIYFSLWLFLVFFLTSLLFVAHYLLFFGVWETIVDVTGWLKEPLARHTCWQTPEDHHFFACHADQYACFYCCSVCVVDKNTALAHNTYCQPAGYRSPSTVTCSCSLFHFKMFSTKGYLIT